MAKPPKDRAASKPELYPDAWQRFQTLTRQVMKAGPQHRKAPTSKPVKRAMPRSR